MNIDEITASLRKGSEVLALQTAAKKNKALEAVAKALNENRASIIAENNEDIKAGRASGLSESLIDRLMLNDSRIDGIIESIHLIISQTDPVGEEIGGWKTPNGMTIRQVRVPIGVVAIIYENRPNVTVDAFCLAYKSGNAILLRGSSSAYNSNRKIVEIIKNALSGVEDGVANAIELVKVKEHDHSDVDQILNAVGKIDVVLPRGSGKSLIQRPSVCNACECIVVHKNVAESFLPQLAKTFAGRVKMHADKIAYKILKNCSESKNVLFEATENDFGNEYLDYECCIKTVENIEDAISYINAYNTKHSDCIITENLANAKLFQTMVDASCVYVNVSTRFTDGGEFGFGAELGISTQKLHARGPMGIKTLTTTKYLIDGEGHIR